jgi:hypothetical protein
VPTELPTVLSGEIPTLRPNTIGYCKQKLTHDGKTLSGKARVLWCKRAWSMVGTWMLILEPQSYLKLLNRVIGAGF